MFIVLTGVHMFTALSLAIKTYFPILYNSVINYPGHMFFKIPGLYTQVDPHLILCIIPNQSYVFTSMIHLSIGLCDCNIFTHSLV